MVLSTTAAGTISQIARGGSSFFTRSRRSEHAVAPSWANSSTAFADMSKAAQLWPPLSSRLTMFAPILPRPTIPSCIRVTPLLTSTVLPAEGLISEDPSPQPLLPGSEKARPSQQRGGARLPRQDIQRFIKIDGLHTFSFRLR